MVISEFKTSILDAKASNENMEQMRDRREDFVVVYVNVSAIYSPHPEFEQEMWRAEFCSIG